ncbi:hypothetical protein EDC39_11090 [Geothermobacter ehrlichii]|uniref:DUF4177 domain-containing protein n=1 Tax=Geothermobacter ehrlichii TaxID=213224 RepID=A0A5D3WI73_9BACT|nr:DUF4177 domain-containing protein [Geothermobacter ehrlichii]TYO97550.1 hypothetical protein EDC39_11090 [Geothermobacter ehrlichii]
MSSAEYKVVETTTVTDESLEEIINTWVGHGWTLDTIHFAMRESSRRPAMAFVLFVRSAPENAGIGAGESSPRV